MSNSHMTNQKWRNGDEWKVTSSTKPRTEDVLSSYGACQSGGMDYQTAHNQNQMETSLELPVRKALPCPGPIVFPSATHDTLSLGWKPPEGCARDQKFRVSWRNESSGGCPCSVVVPDTKLCIQDLSPGETYHFTVAAINERGEQSASVSATKNTVYKMESILSDIPVPEELTVKRMETSAQLSWTLPPGMERTPHNFLIFCRSHEQSPPFITTTSRSTVITGLQPHIEYAVRVSVACGNGREGSPASCTIPPALSPPGPIELTSVTPTSVSLGWRPPGGGLTKRQRFRVTWRGERSGGPHCTVTPGTHLRIQDLSPGEKYEFTVTAISESGEQSPSVSIIQHIDVPVPEELTVKKTATSAHLSWTVPASMERTDHTFLVSYGCRGKSPEFISTASCSTVITGLQPDTEYTINVSIVCGNGGQSQPASKTILTVEDSETLRVKSLSPTSVEVSWSLSQEMNRTPRKFLISYICEETELQTITTHSCSTVITDLKEDSQYLFTVSATLGSGQTVELASSIFCTDVPPPGPVQITSKTPNSVCLMWKSLERKYSYMVTRKCCRLESSFTVWDPSVTIQDIGPKDVLEITIVTLGRNNRQSSTSTTVRYEWTGIPPPTNVEVRNNRVTWRKPAGLDQVSFLFTVCSKGSVMFNVNTENTECTLPKDALQLGSSYVMYVTTIVNNAQSSPNIVGISEDGTLTQDKEAHSKQSQLPITPSYADAKATSTQHGTSHSTSYHQESLLPTSEDARSKYSGRSQTEAKTRKKYYIHASGKTLKYCSDFKNVWLQRLAEVKSVDASDMVLAVCMVVSRVGTDVEAALKEIPGNKPTVLVVMHHTFDPHYVVPDSRKYARRDDMLVVDCLFYEDQGLLRCETNSKAQSTVLKWIDAKVIVLPD
ncbi:hypothetical protein ACEWY4_025044 [Coilia grayii]|uniref:Fibronectin type-III domain-containing protein n=1 Tax=Coilia grayii TaxID=363190 RepID=A0ABD1IYG7_9TELE